MLIGPQVKITTLLTSEQYSTPGTAAGFLNATGITPTSIYLCRDSSGSLIDSVSGNNLAQVGTPKYNVPVVGQFGVSYTSSGSGHGSNVNDFAGNSVIFGCIATHPATPDAGLPGLIGRVSNTSFPCAAMYRTTETLKYPTFLIRDTVSTLTLSDATINTVEPIRPILYLAQIDRANTTARMVVADANRILTNQSGSIAGFGSFTGGTSPIFYTGDASIVFRAGNALSYGFYATGAQCEGSTKLLNVARGLGFGGF